MKVPGQPDGAPSSLDPHLLDTLPVALMRVRDERIIYANAAFGRLMHEPVPSLIGRCVWTLTVPEELETVQQRARARLRGDRVPEAYTATILRAGGERVRVEVQPRTLGGDELLIVFRELEERVRDTELLFALGELSTRTQRERTVSGVIRTACEGLHALGYQTVLFRFRASGLAKLEGHAMRPDVLAYLEERMGRRLGEVVAPTEIMPVAKASLQAGRAVLIEDVGAAMQRLLAALGRTWPSEADALLGQFGLGRGVLAPVIVGGRPWGFFVAGALSMELHEVGALSLFTAQLGSAVETATSFEELAKQNARLESVQQVAMLPSELTLEQLVPKLLQLFADAVRADVACLYLVDEARNELVLAGTTPYEGPLTANEKYARLPLDRTLTGSAAQSLRPRAVSVDEWPEFSRPDIRASGFVQNAIVPLMVNGRYGGTVNLARKRDERFDDDDLRTAEVLAAQVALQVERARLYQDVKRRVHDLSLINELGTAMSQHLDLAQVMDTAVQMVGRIVDVPNTFVMALDEDRKTLSVLASNVASEEARTLKLPLDDHSAAALAFRTQRPVTIDDAQNDQRLEGGLIRRFGHRALLAVPLLSEGRSVGALILSETRRPRVFSGADVERAVTVANQLAAAVDNARLYDEQLRRVRQLRLLLQMSQVITGSLDLEQILRASAESIARIVDATDSFIWLLDGTQLRGEVASALEHQEHFSRVRIPLSTPSLVSHAITERAPQRIEDALHSPLVNQELNARYRQQSLLALPLMLRDVPIGAISIGDRRKKRAFTDDQIELALLISRQVAVAIDNARLFEDLKRSYQELSRAQQELVKRERLAALGELSAVVAHEVRNPLGVIFNSLASLRRMLPSTNDGRLLLDIVGEEADRLNRMVSDLLDFARPNEAQLKPESLDAVVGGALEAASRAMPAPHIKVSFEPAPDVPEVPLDAQMLRQAVVNLVVNAVQAMPRGGNVVVRTAVESRGVTRFARVEVQDDGPGIPPEVADRVFQPFFTTKAAGTGLGLAVVKRIADAHRAELTLKSRPGHGSTFSLCLPL